MFPLDVIEKMMPSNVVGDIKSKEKKDLTVEKSTENEALQK